MSRLDVRAGRPMSSAMRAWPPRPTLWLGAAALVCVAMLATVHVLQHLGWPPCELCLHEREVVWTALAIAVAGRIAAFRFDLAPRIACAALAAAFAVGAVLGAYHAGVEWKWWPGPVACTGAGFHGKLSGADIGAVFSGAKTVHVVRCDEAAFRVAGLSLAGWNAILSAALAAVSLSALTSRSRR